MKVKKEYAQKLKKVDIRIEKGQSATGKDWLVYFSILIFYIIVFRIVTQSGMSADDMWNSNVWASAYTGEGRAWDIFSNQIMVWLHMGRFFPFSNLAPFVFILCPTVFTYKLAILIFVYIDNLICSLCLRAITKSREIAFIYMLLFPVFIQLTPEFDSGLYCYHMLIQAVVLFCFLSLYGLVQYIDTDQKRYAVLSAVSFFIALGTYEVAFVFLFVLIYVAAVKTKSFHKTIRYGLADGIVFAVMCIGNIVTRLFLKTGNYDGIAVQWNIKLIIITLLKQCSTCVPLGRYICSGLKYCIPYSDVYTYSLTGILKEITVLDCLTVVVFVGLLIYILRMFLQKNEPFKQWQLVTLIVCGLMIWILPGCLIAISSKYQQMLGWCSGHLPAYMQSLGFTMLITGLCFLIWEKIRRKQGRIILSCICGVLAGVILLLNQVTSREAVEYMNRFRKYPQENIAYAAEAGFFEELESNPDKVIVGTTAYIYDTSSSREFYSKFTKTDIRAIPRQELLNQLVTIQGLQTEYDMSVEKKQYYGVFNMAGKETGALIMGYCSKMELNEAGTDFRHVWIQNPKIFIRGEGYLAISEDWVLIERGKDYEIYIMEGTYDIMQRDEYYNSETEIGVLYQ